MDTTIETITNTKEIVDNIRREIEGARGTHIWDDYVNALRLISQVVFTRSSGFILELIQNAEDSGLDMTEPGRFEIRMNKQRVKISHNGRPFNENDVKAISGIRSSKKPERGFLGYLGIGFKSVLKITDSPEIYSNGFQFKFDRTHWTDPSSSPWHVIPIWIDEPSEPVDASRTTFVIPFREPTDASRIVDEIKKIRLELYLFLRWLRTIEITDEISGEHWTLENLGENQEGISTLKSDGEERRFKFFHRNVQVPEWVKDDRLTQEYRANVTQREIAIGFALDENGNLVTEGLRDYSKKTLRKRFASLDEFLKSWNGAERKDAIIEELNKEGLLFEPLAEEVGKNLDPFDLICHVAFDQPPLTRRDRVENVRKRDVFTKYGAKARAVLEALLQKYQDEGVMALDDPRILRVAPFDVMGTPVELLKQFGGRKGFEKAVHELQSVLYEKAA